MYRKTGDKPYVFRGEITHQHSADGPVDDIHATDITTADGEVIPFVCASTVKAGEVIGVVTEVCIHLEDIVIGVFQCPFEACDIGGTESQFPCPLKDKQSVGEFFFHESFDDGCCTVG